MITLFWTSGGSPGSHTLSPACNRILRATESGAAPADLFNNVIFTRADQPIGFHGDHDCPRKVPPYSQCKDICNNIPAKVHSHRAKVKVKAKCSLMFDLLFSDLFLLFI